MYVNVAAGPQTLTTVCSSNETAFVKQNIISFTTSHVFAIRLVVLRTRLRLTFYLALYDSLVVRESLTVTFFVSPH